MTDLQHELLTIFKQALDPRWWVLALLVWATRDLVLAGRLSGDAWAVLLTLAGGDAMPSAAISKLLSMRTGQGYAEFAVAAFGTDGIVGDPDTPSGRWAEYLMGSRATTIYGGTSEVQLNIIAERLLGLPRDP